MGFHHTRGLKTAKRDKPSAYLHPSVIDEYLANEVSLGRSISTPPFPNLQVSSSGIIPKKGQPGKWCLIVDLSSPQGFSVNDSVNAEDFSLQYITMDQVIHRVSSFGEGALMSQLP